MAEETGAAVGAGLDVNTAGNPTEVAMAYLQDEVNVVCCFFEAIVGVEKLQH